MTRAEALRRSWRRVWVGALLGAVVGCGGDAGYRELHFREASRPPLDVRLQPESLELVEGVAISTRVSAIDDAGDPMPVLTFESEDTDVFGVARGPDLGWWVFYGVAPGAADVRVLSDGRFVGRVPVGVRSQR